MVGDLVTSPREGHNRSAGVDKSPQARNRTQLLRRGIQQEDSRSFPDREIVRRAHQRRFDALCRERTRDRRWVEALRMKELVLHRRSSVVSGGGGVTPVRKRSGRRVTWSAKWSNTVVVCKRRLNASWMTVRFSTNTS